MADASEEQYVISHNVAGLGWEKSASRLGGARCYRHVRAAIVTDLLTYLLTFLLTYLPTYLLTYLLTCLLIYLLTYLLIYLLTYLLIYLLTYLLTYVLTSKLGDPVVCNWCLE